MQTLREGERASHTGNVKDRDKEIQRKEAKTSWVFSFFLLVMVIGFELRILHLLAGAPPFATQLQSFLL
jgi:hypothetical protein